MAQLPFNTLKGPGESRNEFHSVLQRQRFLQQHTQQTRKLIYQNCLPLFSQARTRSVQISHFFEDSNGLFTNISTRHEQKDYGLRLSFGRLRDSFQANEINTLAWILGPLNLADALTKINSHAFKALNAS